MFLFFFRSNIKGFLHGDTLRKSDKGFLRGYYFIGKKMLTAGKQDNKQVTRYLGRVWVQPNNSLVNIQ